MAMDFPSSPTIGAIYAAPGGPTYKWDGALWMPQVGAVDFKTALPSNRITNPSMQISQENADNVSGTVAGLSYFFADQWMMAWSLTGGTAKVRRTRPASSGSDTMEFTVVAGVASLAAANYIQLFQTVEGEKIKGFLWGTANAKRAVLRFLFYTTLAGTYTACIRNGALDRSFLAKFTALANTWQEIVVPVPGDVTGTWPTTSALAMHVGVNMASGSDYVGVEGWQAGHRMVAPGTTNGAVTGAMFFATDFGLYLDDGNTGLPPRFEIPDIAEEMLRCQRYYQVHRNMLVAAGYTNAGAAFYNTFIIPMMRAAPTALFSAPTYSNSSGIILNVATPSVCRLSAIMTAAGSGWVDVTVLLNARPA